MASPPYFNPRSREGSDAVNRKSSSIRKNFNPRSREGSDDMTSYREEHFGHFNPRSREGSDTSRWFIPRDRQISIHAPAKGATVDIFDKAKKTIISIHAPAKGATAYTHLDNGLLTISIHAPAKGATHLIIVHFIFCQFQSTLPRRERLGI